LSTEISLLAASAAAIGFFHTLIGPDHYLPFIAMAKSGQWSMRKTALVTLLCGIGHVLGSVLLGLVGIGLGVAVSQLEGVEAARGELAAWLLISFGLVYMLWGLRQAWHNRPHRHTHAHADGLLHNHQHRHQHEHLHVHETGSASTPWVLFVIFVLGPCEPLIPLLMVPAAAGSWGGVLMVAGVFGAATVATMLAVVMLSVRGLQRLPLAGLQRYAHALAGAAVFASGAAIQFLGL
jgi:sulfite exporter TauE/SafE